ncbi:MAG: putative hydro-lyase [Candidatus Limnocylindria bacterium]
MSTSGSASARSSSSEMASLGPAEIRAAIRSGRHRRGTAGLASGYAQANLVVLPRDWAGEFREFCLRNPKPCPLLDVTAPGSPEPMRLAPGADLRTDIPGYRVSGPRGWREVDDLRALWRADLVAFLLGCSYSFEDALRREGIAIRHIDLGRTVPMYRTSVECAPAGRLHGPMVVSMRPIPEALTGRSVAICARYPGSHGGPIHIGDPARLGIHDLSAPDYGDAVPILPGEVPVFWGCGVTPQAVLEVSGCEWFAAHRPGHMFVSDAAETIAPLEE